MATDKRSDPLRGFNFQVEIDGIGTASFSEVSGLTADGDAVDYREGTDAINNVRKLPGLRKFTIIMLKRGYTPDSALWQWYAHIVNGQDDRRNGSVVLLNEQRKPVLRWHFENAWINKIEGPRSRPPATKWRSRAWSSATKASASSSSRPEMPTYSTPGAYIEWQDASAPVIQPLRTDIAGFVGLAQRGPVSTPVPVESVKQFEAHFGSFIGGGFLAYAVRGFFENGGRRCWIVRVAAAEGRAAASSSLPWTAGGCAALADRRGEPGRVGRWPHASRSRRCSRRARSPSPARRARAGSTSPRSRASSAPTSSSSNSPGNTLLPRRLVRRSGAAAALLHPSRRRRWLAVRSGARRLRPQSAAADPLARLLDRRARERLAGRRVRVADADPGASAVRRARARGRGPIRSCCRRMRHCRSRRRRS